MKAKSRPDLWIDTKVLAITKGKPEAEAESEAESRIAINRYLELADLALNNNSLNTKKVA